MSNRDPINTPTYAELDGTPHYVHAVHHRRRFHIVDVARAGAGGTVIETLMYPDDLAAAEALAVDYAVQKRAYHANLREEDPYPASSHSRTRRADQRLDRDCAGRGGRIAA